jgi:hypothetical protein
MNPKKKPRRCLGLALDSGLDLASLVSPTALLSSIAQKAILVFNETKYLTNKK